MLLISRMGQKMRPTKARQVQVLLGRQLQNQNLKKSLKQRPLPALLAALVTKLCFSFNLLIIKRIQLSA